MPTRTRRLPAAVTAGASAASDVEHVVDEGLPFGLQPVEPPEPLASKPIDLERYDPKWRGFQIVVDLDLELRAQEAAMAIQDDHSSNAEKVEAIYQFLETVLLAWNFSESYVDSQGRLRSRPVPQPRDGGVRHLKNSQLQALLQAVNSAFVPAPNS